MMACENAGTEQLRRKRIRRTTTSLKRLVILVSPLLQSLTSAFQLTDLRAHRVKRAEYARFHSVMSSSLHSSDMSQLQESPAQPSLLLDRALPPRKLSRERSGNTAHCVFSALN